MKSSFAEHKPSQRLFCGVNWEEISFQSCNFTAEKESSGILTGIQVMGRKIVNSYAWLTDFLNFIYEELFFIEIQNQLMK
jgi:hypothetical protein